ncbi:MAG: HEPN domain-containing protein [Nitrospiraceae bacterium]|nr:HEPN domain-containing protein [Nitrospiraceae bacterium]
MNRALVLAEWKRAKQALRAAEALVTEDCHEDAVSRSYYAILHAAKAALYVHDETAASHAAVKRLFGLHLIKSGILEPVWSGYLVESLDDRLAADYDAEVFFSRAETDLECRRSAEFLVRIARYLGTKGFSDHELSEDIPHA